MISTPSAVHSKSFKLTTDRPTLVVLRSVIAWGAPNKANTHGAHGAPLGEEEIRLTKTVLRLAGR